MPPGNSGLVQVTTGRWELSGQMEASAGTTYVVISLVYAAIVGNGAPGVELHRRVASWAGRVTRRGLKTPASRILKG